MLPLLALTALAATTASASTDMIQRFKQSPVEWIYPPPRSGFNASVANYAGCGDMPAGSRTYFPMSGGQLSFNSLTVAADISILHVAQINPVSFHSWTASGVDIEDMSPGEFCASAPDFESSYEVGDQLTMIIMYQRQELMVLILALRRQDGLLRLCRHITLVETSNYTAPSYTCSNTSSLLTMASGVSTSAGQEKSVYANGTSSSTSSSVTVTTTAGVSNGSGLSAAKGGGIGAVCGVAFAAALVGAAYALGYLPFKKNRGDLELVHDSDSMRSNIPLNGTKFNGKKQVV
ncbi:hypothetical protein L198_03617 [Cryptococcus wingfieldii CBS 7118]|uniref:Copper acquisition factor BIM1-like domain-containing protein n=1 Tax=Cryptococcus wingfieldii CBS 7118 TaxID=1295528 RepID=A0A1E3JBW7_9TREE|nr:hypothetical protein L198_03617 [Cryptococcus wingfieldii CBS 7118]ODN98373.1 hypothetical protein L198_03617 [Cryptococcus wingfieldii CBS 7118]